MHPDRPGQKRGEFQIEVLRSRGNRITERNFNFGQWSRPSISLTTVSVSDRGQIGAIGDFFLW